MRKELISKNLALLVVFFSTCAVFSQPNDPILITCNFQRRIKIQKVIAGQKWNPGQLDTVWFVFRQFTFSEKCRVTTNWFKNVFPTTDLKPSAKFLWLNKKQFLKSSLRWTDRQNQFYKTFCLNKTSVAGKHYCD